MMARSTTTSTTTIELARRKAGRRNNGRRGENGAGGIGDEFREDLAEKVNEWVMVAGIVTGCIGENGAEIPANARKAARLESEIRGLIRGFPGRVFLFAGIAIWADADTPAGKVRTCEVVVLS